MMKFWDELTGKLDEFEPPKDVVEAGERLDALITYVAFASCRMIKHNIYPDLCDEAVRGMKRGLMEAFFDAEGNPRKSERGPIDDPNARTESIHRDDEVLQTEPAAHESGGDGGDAPPV